MLMLPPISFPFFKFYVKYCKKVCGNGLSSVLHGSLGARWLWFESQFCHLQAGNCGQVTQSLFLSVKWRYYCTDLLLFFQGLSRYIESRVLDTHRNPHEHQCYHGSSPLEPAFLSLPTSDTNVNHSVLPCSHFQPAGQYYQLALLFQWISVSLSTATILVQAATLASRHVSSSPFSSVASDFSQQCIWSCDSHFKLLSAESQCLRIK